MIEKELEEFGKNKKVKSGFNSQCKQCGREYAMTKYRKEKNPNPLTRTTKDSLTSDKPDHRIGMVGGLEKPFSEFELAKAKKHGISFRCKTCAHEYKKKWAAEHIEERRAKQKAFREANPELVKQRKKEEYIKHKDRYNAHNKAWYKNNKSSLLLQQKEYKAIRHKEDPTTKLADRLRHRLHQALKGNAKSDHTLTLLGCTIPELRIHLERQFSDGMNWDNWNYYGWHIDHIKPLALFDLSLPEEQKRACHFSNLQPLWQKDNFIKGARYIG